VRVRWSGSCVHVIFSLWSTVMRARLETFGTSPFPLRVLSKIPVRAVHPILIISYNSLIIPPQPTCRCLYFLPISPTMLSRRQV